MDCEISIENSQTDCVSEAKLTFVPCAVLRRCRKSCIKDLVKSATCLCAFSPTTSMARIWPSERVCWSKISVSEWLSATCWPKIQLYLFEAVGISHLSLANLAVSWSDKKSSAQSRVIPYQYHLSLWRPLAFMRFATYFVEPTSARGMTAMAIYAGFARYLTRHEQNLIITF